MSPTKSPAVDTGATVRIGKPESGARFWPGDIAIRFARRESSRVRAGARGAESPPMSIKARVSTRTRSRRAGIVALPGRSDIRPEQRPFCDPALAASPPDGVTPVSLARPAPSIAASRRCVTLDDADRAALDITRRSVQRWCDLSIGCPGRDPRSPSEESVCRPVTRPSPACP